MQTYTFFPILYLRYTFVFSALSLFCSLFLCASERLYMHAFGVFAHAHTNLDFFPRLPFDRMTLRAMCSFYLSDQVLLSYQIHFDSMVCCGASHLHWFIGECRLWRGEQVRKQRRRCCYIAIPSISTHNSIHPLSLYPLIFITVPPVSSHIPLLFGSTTNHIFIKEILPCSLSLSLLFNLFLVSTHGHT